MIFGTSKSEMQERVALVTGGGTGIGRSVCEQLAQLGLGTILVNYSRSSSEAEETVNRLQELGSQAAPIQADVSDPARVTELFATIERDYGRLDHLVNNAGTTELIPFPDLDAVSDSTWKKILELNVIGTFNCSRAAAGLLRATSGSIVNVGSISAMRGVGSSLPYGVSKAGVLQLTRGLATALAPDIRVNSVSAGTVLTRWHNDLVGEEEFAKRSTKEAEDVPMQRLATPDDIAEGIVFLLLASFVTGQDLLVDGGKALRY